MVLIRFAQLEPRDSPGLDLSKFPHFELGEDFAAANYIVSQAKVWNPGYDPHVKVVQAPGGEYGILLLEEDTTSSYMPSYEKGSTVWGEELVEVANYMVRDTVKSWRRDVRKILKERGFGPGNMSDHALWEYNETMLQERLDDSRRGNDWSEEDESIMTRTEQGGKQTPVIYVKYNGQYGPPADIEEEMRQLFTEEELNQMWYWVQEMWWEYATELAKEHGYQDAYSTGRQGGYLYPVHQGNREVDLEDPDEVAQFRLFKKEIDSLYEGAEEMLMEEYRNRLEERKYELQQEAEQGG